jgi:uncharacterized protein YjiS (DUF1127 family)
VTSIIIYLAACLSAAGRAWQARRRRRVARREFERLDERALRDLGVGRDEFDTWCAEAEGRVDRTLRRVSEVRAAKEAP